jgi:MATE family, multidrug efflux pump
VSSSIQKLPDSIPIEHVPLPQIAQPTWRLVLLLALPVLGQQFLLLIVTLSDRYIAGHLKLGDELLQPLDAARQPALQAAQTTANYLGWFISSFSVLVSAGSTALVARFVGAGNREHAIKATHQSLLLAVGFAALATAAALLGGLEELVHILQLRGEAAELAVAYLQPLFALLAFVMIESAGIACLVGAGDTHTGLWVTMGVAVVNLPLAWGFAFGLGPFPRLGFVGIALGTALSHAIGGLVVMAILARGRFGLKLHMRLFRPDGNLCWRLLRISVPAGLDSLSVVVGQFWFLSIVNSLGDTAASAHGIALGWEALGFLSGAAFGTAAMTLIGQELGAGRPARATHAGWVACACACGIMSFMGAVFFLLAEPMFALFCPQPEQQPIIVAGVPVLRLIAFAMPPLACTIVFTQALRGAGDTRVPVLFTWVGFFVVRIPLAYWLALPDFDLGPWRPIPGCNLGLLGAWLAMFADILVRGAFFLYRFISGSWQRMRV